jgi:hypothetical protein
VKVVLVRIASAMLKFLTLARISSLPSRHMLEMKILLQSGVGVGVGVLDGVGVFDGVGVLVSVAVLVGVEVLVGVGVLDGVGEGPAVAGRPITRAVRNCSTIPSRFEVRCRSGQMVLIIGVISGWSKSMATITRSPGSPASSAGVQFAAIGTFESDSKKPTPDLLEQTVTLKNPGSPTVATVSSFNMATAPAVATSLIDGILAPSSCGSVVHGPP